MTKKIEIFLEQFSNHPTVILIVTSFSIMAARIYENQKTAGDELLRLLFDQREPHVLLLAQMQMGKSGTYWYTLLEALKTEKVKQVFLISGNREKELRAQVQEDRRAYTQLYSKSLRKRITILWGADLTKFDSAIPEDTLIVWDEAHYAQSLSNAPFKFFQQSCLEGLLNGTTTQEAEKRNIRLLTVSATPFSELLSKLDEPSHKVVRLQPSESYFGVKHYLDNDRVKPSFQINEDTAEEMAELLSLYSDRRGYMIVRLMNTLDRLQLLVEQCERLDIRYEIMNSRERTIEVEDLKKKPEKATVVIISGMLRMGKVMPKEHISMVFEEKTPKNTKHSDTGLQGLLGRVCGHSSAPFDIDVYIEPFMIDYASDYVESYDSEQGPLCRPAMNVRKQEGYSRQKANTCVAVMEDPPKKGTRKELIKRALECFPELEGLTFHISNLDRKTHESTYNNLLRGVSSKRVDSTECLLYKRYSGEQPEVWVLTNSFPDETSETSEQFGLVRDACVFKRVEV